MSGMRNMKRRITISKESVKLIKEEFIKI
jgi:hypothetical protein